MRSRAFAVLTACVCGCVNGGGFDDGERGSEDARTTDAAAIDAWDSATTDDASGSDIVEATDTMPAKDTAPPADVGPCKTTCGGNECGPIPDHCGGTVTCGDCGGAPGEYCETIASPIFRTGVHNAIAALAATSPSYLDVADVVGGNYRVLDNVAFVTALVAEMSKKPGLVCIPDPVDGTEIRVRPATVDAAENYHVIISSGYTAYKYTSTCKPAGF